MTDEGVAALGACDPATGAHRLARLRALSLGGCVKLSGRGLGRLPPGLEVLRLGFCSNLKVPRRHPFRASHAAPGACQQNSSRSVGPNDRAAMRQTAEL